MNTTSLRRYLVISIAATSVVLSGCRAMRQARAERRAARAANAAAGVVTLDGKFNDWPANVSTMADANWVYFRVTVEGQTKPLQASDSTLALWLDADDNPGTGVPMPSPRVASALGVDLIVEFSPQDAAGKTTPGVAAYAVETGGRKPLTQPQLEIAAAPTVASPAYEIRISRYLDAAAAPMVSKLLGSSGQARGMFVLFENGRVVGWSDPEALRLPAAGKARPVSDAGVPTKAAGTIRVLSYNVLKDEPGKNPGPFSRLIQVIKPDIILFQEWNADQATAQAWFTAVVSGETRWHARTGEGGDVLIVSRFPIRPLTNGPVKPEGATNPARFASGIVSTPNLGDIAVASLHLKCCGTVGSTEDQKRIAEATAIQAALESALGQTPTMLRIVGGDFNLVGSNSPLEITAKGLDFDGSPLSPADPMLIGDSASYTWSSDKEVFPPGRLDYILYSDASATISSSFILDTRRLSQKSLALLGVDRTDSAASDHLPVVVDLRPR